MATYTSNYNLEKPEASDPFGDFRQSYNSNMDIIDANLGGGGGGGGHTIIDPNGSDMAQRAGLQFTGSCSVTDDAVNDKTVVNISGGGGSVNYSTSEKVIGTWITGKPLYEKTFNISSSIPQNTTFVVGDITNLNLVDVHGIALLGTGGGFNMPYYNDGNTMGQIWWSATELKILQKGYNVTGAIVTIRYTKTTD